MEKYFSIILGDEKCDFENNGDDQNEHECEKWVNMQIKRQRMIDGNDNAVVKNNANANDAERIEEEIAVLLGEKKAEREKEEQIRREWKEWLDNASKIEQVTKRKRVNEQIERACQIIKKIKSENKSSTECNANTEQIFYNNTNKSEKNALNVY